MFALLGVVHGDWRGGGNGVGRIISSSAEVGQGHDYCLLLYLLTGYLQKLRANIWYHMVFDIWVYFVPFCCFRACSWLTGLPNVTVSPFACTQYCIVLTPPLLILYGHGRCVPVDLLAVLANVISPCHPIYFSTVCTLV